MCVDRGGYFARQAAIFRHAFKLVKIDLCNGTSSMIDAEKK